jgi:hypothetical protein
MNGGRPTVTAMALRAARDEQGLLALLSPLGYDTAAAKPFELSAVALGGRGWRIRTAHSNGPGVLVGEVDALPTTLKTVGHRMLDEFHDPPAAATRKTSVLAAAVARRR